MRQTREYTVVPPVWAIGRGEQYNDPESQDHVEGQSLYDLLERQIVPIFYDRGDDNIPREWVRRMKQCLRKLAPMFNTNRMVAQYTGDLYEPASPRCQLLAQNDLARSIELARDKDILRSKWDGVSVVAVNANGDGHFKVGGQMRVEAIVDLNGLAPNFIRVQLFAGPVNADGRVDHAEAIDMKSTREVSPGRILFTGTLDCKASGRHGYAVRLLPGLADLATPFEPGMITWG